MKLTARAAGVLVAVLALTGCPDSDPAQGGFLNRGPIASAGPDRTVGRGSWVSLDGSGTRGAGPLTFQWAQTAGPAVVLSDPRLVMPSFLAPAADATLRFSLTVRDGRSRASTDEVVITAANLPPVVSGLSISPAEPTALDALTASVLASDPDPSDGVTLAWEWRRNGVLLEGETGPALPPLRAVRGDVVQVTVAARDGTAVTSASASVTLRDAPPTVAIVAPATVTWGAPVTFTASPSDPDGDPVPPGSCLLRRGPAGMTVSPSCEGTWTPTLPMFDRTLDVTFEVGLVGSSAAAERTIRVVDPARRYPLRRGALAIPLAQRGLVAFDPDGDGTSSLLVAASSGLYELARVAGSYEQVWSYPFLPGAGTPASIAAADVDGDGRPELFVAAPSSYGAPAPALVKLDGVDRREVARLTLGCGELSAADLDQDGAADLVCLVEDFTSYPSSQRVVVVDPVTLTTTWQSGQLPVGRGFAVGNVDSDPPLEVVTDSGRVIDGATRATEWAYSGPFGGLVATGDLDGDGVEEIVGMDDWSRFRGFSALLRSPLWEQASFDNDALLVADLDRDGVAEIVVGEGQWGNVTVYRYRPGSNDLLALTAIDSQDHGVVGLVAADLDGDGGRELAWGTGWTSSGADALVVAGWSPQLGVEWTSPAPVLDGPFLGAVPARTAAGAAPALLFETPRTDAAYGGARLARLDPSGAVSVSPQIGTNWRSSGGLDVADVDLDGVDEAFLATAELYDGYLSAFDFAAGTASWTSPPNVGDGRAVVAADLTGDGIPDLVTVTAEGYVLAYDVAHAALVFRSTSIGGGVGLAVADVDDDGQPEVVALAGNRLVIFRRAPSGPVPWIEGPSTALTYAAGLAVADCDGDAVPEIHVLSGSYWPGMTVRRFDGDLTETGSFPVRGTAVSLYVEDLGTPRKNLVLARSDYVLEAVDPGSGGTIWRSPRLWGEVPPGSLRYVDLDADGFREIAYGTTSGMHLTR